VTPDASIPTDDPGVAVVGVGLISPLGLSPWSTLRALLEGRRTADRLADLPDGLDATAVARATGAVSVAVHAAEDPALDLAERAARQALADAQLAPGSADAARTPVWIASSKGAVLSLLDPRSEGRAQAIAAGPVGLVAARVRDRLGLGAASAPVAACATSLVALAGAVHAVRRGECARALVVAVESALHPVFVRSYERLGALAPATPAAAHVARPLDRGRAGFTLCEVSAAVVLERFGARRSPWARAGALATGAEPFDMVRPPDRYATLEQLARRLCAGADRIALVQPHAPGTADNDERELAALARALGDASAQTPAYASKGALGHGLGAAGLVNVVLSCLFMRCGRVPPMPWLCEPIGTPFSLSRVGGALAHGPHLVVAQGFGGHVAAVRLDPP